MHQDNYVYLQDKLTALGFDGVFDQVLKANMALGQKQFELKAQSEMPEGTLLFTFDLSHAQKETQHPNEYYFLNSVLATLAKEGQETLQHKFMLFKQMGNHLDQMKNFMAGRSVFETFQKNGRTVEVWRRIDFKAKDQYENSLMRPTYSDRFSLEKELNKLPFNKADVKERAVIIAKLKDGDLVKADIKQGSNVETVSLIAMPHLGVINMINGKGEKVSINNNNLKVIGKDDKPELSETTSKLIDSKDKNKEKDKDQTQTQGQSRRAS
jgi:hypothetical protein